MLMKTKTIAILARRRRALRKTIVTKRQHNTNNNTVESEQREHKDVELVHVFTLVVWIYV